MKILLAVSSACCDLPNALHSFMSLTLALIMIRSKIIIDFSRNRRLLNVWILSLLTFFKIVCISGGKD